MRILKDNAVAVIVDVQQKLVPHIHEHERLVRNIGILTRGLQVLELPILVTEQYRRGLGPTVAPVVELFREFVPIEKIAFSCCGDSGFMASLKRMRRRHVILMGIEAHVCVLQTALDLLQAGYKPVVIEDCVSSRRPQDRDVALYRMRGEGVIPATYESILFELCATAGTDQFRAISRLVKYAP